jgi:uncharacterized protein
MKLTTKLGIFLCLMLLVFSACTADQSIDESRSKAQQENVNDQYKLGLKYYNGQGVSKNNVEAMKYFKKAAAQGHADAQYKLGRMYEYDVEIPGEPEAMKAQEDFAKKADAGTENRFDAKNYLMAMGNLMQNVNQLQAEAVKWYKKAAFQGHAEAQYKLGFNYAIGFGGLQEDHSEALKWWKKAAEQGHASAQYELGGMYYRGEVVSQNYAEAVKLWEKAADQGHPAAVHRLGIMYYKGQGTPQNFVKAYPHLIVAWTIEKKNVKEPISEIVKKLTPAQIAEGQRMAQNIFDKIIKRYPGNKASTLKKIEDLKEQKT